MGKVLDANVAIAKNADDEKKRMEAIAESIATGKPVTYQIGHFSYTVSAKL